MRGVDVRFGPDDPETDPRRPEVYDAENPWGVDDDFVLELRSQRPRTRVVDLGCGTGRLAIALANAGALVTAVDPDPAMLRWARSKSGADSVTWIEGTAVDLGSHQFDMALMTSHVAQVYVEDSEWCDVLTHLRRALVSGGVLCFDSRDPRAAGMGPVDVGPHSRSTEAVQTPARVNVTCVTPLGEEVASTS
jgi:ubiquinone/menaquinone biosynthesis C-methylase UbiE